MSPIRVGLIGLSGAPPDEYEGVSWTPNAHLPYLKASPDYEIVALLNSSVESAKAAIDRYELPPSTKAYMKPEGLSLLSLPIIFNCMMLLLICNLTYRSCQ
jgi:predicted dehydrogenase